MSVFGTFARNTGNPEIGGVEIQTTEKQPKKKHG